jgi:hypothetical protein
MDYLDDLDVDKQGIGESVIDPIKCLEFIQKQSPKLAEAKANRVYIEESLRAVKSRVMKLHAGLSVGAQEREAYASDEYKTALDGLRAAVEAETELWWLMIAAQQKIDVWRSQESSARMMDKGAR